MVQCQLQQHALLRHQLCGARSTTRARLDVLERVVREALSELEGMNQYTVRLHPEGGWTPVLHLSGREAPEPRWDAITFPDVVTTLQWVRDHYGDVPVAIDDHLSSRPA